MALILTGQEKDFFEQWYAENNLSNMVIKSQFTNGAGVLVWGKVITYPETFEQWINDDCKIEIPDNYLKPVK